VWEGENEKGRKKGEGKRYCHWGSKKARGLKKEVGEGSITDN